MKAPAGADTAPPHCGLRSWWSPLKATAPTTSNYLVLAAPAATAVRCLGVEEYRILGDGFKKFGRRLLK